MPDDKNKEQKSNSPSIGQIFTDAVVKVGMSNPTTAALVIAADLALNSDKRERVFTGVSDGVRDLFRDVPWAVVWAFDKSGEMLGYDTNTGDRGYSDATAHAVEEWWGKYIKQPTGLGQAEFRMAAGWKLPENVKYNGQENPVYPPGRDDAGKPITEIRDITSIFYKDPRGNLEVLTSADPRWAEITGPYGGVQLLQMIASMGAGAAFKGAVTLPRTLTWGATAASAIGKSVGGIEMASTVGFMGDQFILEPLYFKPNAISDLSRMFAKPNTINTDTARDSLNTLTGQYSHLTGTMTEQLYVPSLSNNESPWKKLNEVSINSVSGIQRSDPFDDIRDEARNPKNYKPSPNTNIRDLIVGDPALMASYYNLVERALNGGLEKNAPNGLKLSDQETYSLRFMMNVTQGPMGSHMNIEQGPIPANEGERRRIRQETKEELNTQIMGEWASAHSKNEDSKDAILQMLDEATPQQLRAYVGAKKGEWGGKLQELRSNEEAEALRMGQVMAMGMMP